MFTYHKKYRAEYPYLSQFKMRFFSFFAEKIIINHIIISKDYTTLTFYFLVDS